jgi:hypothetical protein
MEIVIHKSRLKHFTVPDPMCNIRPVDSVKLLGVIFNNHLSLTGHIDYICSAANQRFHPIKQLQHQGLSKAGSETVFNALGLSKVLYACQSLHGHLRESDIVRLLASPILLALLSVFLSFHDCYCWAGQKQVKFSCCCHL